MEKTLKIAGLELKEKRFPNLYKWAEKNPATLEEQLLSLAKETKTDLQSAAINLENDLAHG